MSIRIRLCLISTGVILLPLGCEYESKVADGVTPQRKSSVVIDTISFVRLESVHVEHGRFHRAFSDTSRYFAVAFNDMIQFYSRKGNASNKLFLHEITANTACNPRIVSCAFPGEERVMVLVQSDSNSIIALFEKNGVIIRKWTLPGVFLANNNYTMLLVRPGMLDMFAYNDSTVIIPIQLADGTYALNNEAWRRKFNMPMVGRFRLPSDLNEAEYTGGFGEFSERLRNNEFYQDLMGMNAWDSFSCRMYFGFGFENTISYSSANSQESGVLLPILSPELERIEQFPFSLNDDVRETNRYFAQNYIFKHLRYSSVTRKIFRTLVHPDSSLIATTPNERNWSICVSSSDDSRILRYEFSGKEISSSHFVQENDSLFYVSAAPKRGPQFTIYTIRL